MAEESTRTTRLDAFLWALKAILGMVVLSVAWFGAPTEVQEAVARALWLTLPLAGALVAYLAARQWVAAPSTQAVEALSLVAYLVALFSGHLGLAWFFLMVLAAAAGARHGNRRQA